MTRSGFCRRSVYRVFQGVITLPSHPYASSQGQLRCLVHAPNRAEALRILDRWGLPVTLSHFRLHWSVTANKQDLEAATRWSWAGRPVLATLDGCGPPYEPYLPSLPEPPYPRGYHA